VTLRTARGSADDPLPKRHGPPHAIRAALDRYRLATSAPRTAWGFESHWWTVRGVATHDRASLDGSTRPPRLVLLHGLAVSHRYLMPVAARLAEHHPVHVIDLPGFGLSGEPGRVLDVAEHAEHVAAWLEATGLAPVVVLGNSFGCQVAVDLAVRHPDRVCGLVLVGPTVDPSARTAFRQVLRWLRDTIREDPLQLPILLRDVRDAGLRRVAGTLAHAVRDPIERKLPLAKVPTLVTRGAKEPIVPMAWAQVASRLLPCGEFAVVPGSPHNANYSAADHLAELVLVFLRRVPPAPGGQNG
jgi:pimeloyl-ACP methyl ester carboxylesterase